MNKKTTKKPVATRTRVAAKTRTASKAKPLASKKTVAAKKPRKTAVASKKTTKKTTQPKGLKHHAKRIYHMTPRFIHGAIAGAFMGIVVVASLGISSDANANPAADACIKTQSGITVNDKNANSFVKLADGCGKRTLVMKSYYAPSASGEPHASQVKYDDGTATIVKTSSSVYTKLNVSMPDPGCFYQVDLVDITNPAGSNGYPIVVAKTGGNRNCIPPPPAYSCNAGLTATQNGPRSTVLSNYGVSATNATYLRTVVDWGDGTNVTNPNVNGLSHAYPADGTYNISTTAYFQITGQFGAIKEVKATPCTAQITFTPVPPSKIQVCVLATKQIITINENEFDISKHSKDLSKCAPTPPNKIQVCEIATYKTITINESEYGNATYPKDKYTTDLSKCIAPPVTPPTPPTQTPPTQLANTGPGAVLVIFGLAMLGGYAFHMRHRHVQHRKHA